MKYISLLVLVVIASWLFYFFAGMEILYAYLISINLITVLFYWYDKYRARNGGSRIPEVVLQLLALVGGSPGALIGQL